MIFGVKNVVLYNRNIWKESIISYIGYQRDHSMTSAHIPVCKIGTPGLQYTKTKGCENFLSSASFNSEKTPPDGCGLSVSSSIWCSLITENINDDSKAILQKQ